MTGNVSKSVSPSDSKTVEARAVEWLIEREEHQKWTEADQTEFDSWLAASPAHAVAFWRVEASWCRTDLIADLRPFDFEQYRPLPRNRSWMSLFRMAAGVGVFALIGAGAAVYLTQPASYETIQTPIGGHKEIALVDGSKIELNTNTEIQLATRDGQRRTVSLVHGEAYFQINHDASHPFTVTALGHRVTDLGTKFLVRADADQVEVSLMEGRARLDPVTGGRTMRATSLMPGDVALVTDNSLVVTRPQSSKLLNEIAWRRGILVFDDTPLSAAAAEFNRYNEKKIIITDRKVAELKINGAIRVNDLDEFSRLARNLFGLRAVNRGDEVVITP